MVLHQPQQVLLVRRRRDGVGADDVEDVCGGRQVQGVSVGGVSEVGGEEREEDEREEEHDDAVEGELAIGEEDGKRQAA